MRIEISSLIDVITNSSDEAYIIKTNLTLDEVETKFYDYLESLGEYGDREKPKFCGVFDADIYYKDREQNEVMVDYPILTNIDDLDKVLETLFGEANVKEAYPNYHR